MDLTNDRVIDDVRAELASDPRLPYPEEIAVESFGDAVTLRGTVGSFAQRRAAVADGPSEGHCVPEGFDGDLLGIREARIARELRPHVVDDPIVGEVHCGSPCLPLEVGSQRPARERRRSRGLTDVFVSLGAGAKTS